MWNWRGKPTKVSNFIFVIPSLSLIFQEKNVPFWNKGTHSEKCWNLPSVPVSAPLGDCHMHQQLIIPGVPWTCFAGYQGVWGEEGLLPRQGLSVATITHFGAGSTRQESSLDHVGEVPWWEPRVQDRSQVPLAASVLWVGCVHLHLSPDCAVPAHRQAHCRHPQFLDTTLGLCPSFRKGVPPSLCLFPRLPPAWSTILFFIHHTCSACRPGRPLWGGPYARGIWPVFVPRVPAVAAWALSMVAAEKQKRAGCTQFQHCGEFLLQNYACPRIYVYHRAFSFPRKCI